MSGKKRRPPRLKGAPPPKIQEDLHLWHETVSQIKPLRTRFKKILKDPPARVAKSLEISWEALEGWAPEAPKSPIALMPRTKKVRPQTRLDLHGLTQKEAFEKVHLHVKRAAGLGLRVMLIITGKGDPNPPHTTGVLRRALPEWLNDPLLRPLVASYAPAKPNDGGEGAFYVFLKATPLPGR